MLIPLANKDGSPYRDDNGRQMYYELPDRRVCQNTLYAAMRDKEMPKESPRPVIVDRPYRFL